MKIEEKLNENTYLGRVNDGKGYRVIVEVFSSELLKVGENYTRKKPIKNCVITSLCKICAEMSGEKFDNNAEYEENVKEGVLGVLDSTCDYDIECFKKDFC